MKILIILFLLMSSCAQWPNPQKEQAELQGQVGAALLESGNYPKALSSLVTAEKMDPHNPIIQNNLGLAYYYRGRTDLAKIHLQKAVTLDSKYTEAKSNLGRILIDLKEYDQAEKLLNQAKVDLTYEKPEQPLLNLGILHLKKHNWDAAKKSLSQAIEYDPDNCMGNTYLGRALFENKEFSSAAMILDRAIGYCPVQNSDEAQYWSAKAYFESKDYDRSRMRFEELVKLYPRSTYQLEAKKALTDKRLQK